MTSIKTITIGTRGSQLALVQANMVKDLLKKNWPNLDIVIKEILTSGDWKPSDGEVRLSVMERGKAQFAKEIEAQLLSGEIDIAVHSMKDMDSILPEGLEIACMLPREDARDCIMLRDREGALKNTSIEQWPEGTVIGTASVRRQAMLLAKNPNLTVTTLRGNVGTRISKLRGELAPDHPNLDATLLASAGLNRLGLEDEKDIIFDFQDMVPAVGQGAIGVEVMANNSQLKDYLRPLNCREANICVSAERAVLGVIDGSCHTPIGVRAAINDENIMTIKAQLLSLDGTQKIDAEMIGAVSDENDAKDLGEKVGQKLIENGGQKLLEQTA